MKWVIVATIVALAAGMAPATADESVAGPTQTPVADQPDWSSPAGTVTTEPEELVDRSGDTGSMTVVYAV